MKKTNNNKFLKTISFSLAMCIVGASFASCGNSGNHDNKGGGYNTTDIATDQQNETEDNFENKYQPEENNDAENNDAEQNSEKYASYVENGFKLVSEYPLSTFSTDVDTASYTNVRRMINNNENINADAVRAEEFINYFKYDYSQPEGDDPVSIATELSDCPWNEDTKLMLVGLQAEDIEVAQRAPMNLVFLIDVSGSMMDANKLPLVQDAFAMLAEGLNEDDRISIVTYAGEDRVVLSGETGDDFEKISDALYNLEAGGSTAGEMGINRAYALAEDNFIDGGNNRVILATDGDLNVGVSSAEGLTTLVEQKRESGVNLSVLGFGTGNYNDSNLEALADNGNGNYSYIDSIDEAEKVLVSEMSGTLYTVAKDVKLQLEFNPANVAAYRLVGYENRQLEDEDFTDDKKDAGDMGAGHSVTALYEIIPAEGVLGATIPASEIILKYQNEENSEETENSAEKKDVQTSDQSDELKKELLTVKLRYKQPDGDTSEEIQQTVLVENYEEKSPRNLAFASCVAEFAMYLRDSQYADISLNEIINTCEEQDLITDEYRSEFVKLVKTVSENLG